MLSCVLHVFGSSCLLFHWLVQGWEDYDQQMHIGHSSLSMWGRNALVLMVDIDDWLVPGQAGATLPQLLAPGGCLAALSSPNCITFPRRDIFPFAEPPAAGAAPDEPGWWRNASGGHPLRNYRFVSARDLRPKTMSRPESAVTPGIHDGRVCAGQDAVANGSTSGKLGSACSVQAPCSLAPESCARVLHVRNMFRTRRFSGNTSHIQPADWLWMLDEHRRRRLD